jgi:hypothetical protein
MSGRIRAITSPFRPACAGDRVSRSCPVTDGLPRGARKPAAAEHDAWGTRAVLAACSQPAMTSGSLDRQAFAVR